MIMLQTDLTSTPLLYLGLTFATYVISLEINRRSGSHPLANPVLLSVCCLITLLWLARVDYQHYFANVQLIHFLLGPATVALAVPLFRHRQKVRRAAVPIIVGVICGSAAGVLSTIAICVAAGIDVALTASLSTKSITAPVAMGIAEHIGGTPSLAAVFAVVTGMLGAAFGPWLLTKCSIQAPMERGLAIGTTSHGQGTARILQESEEAGAFAGLGMGFTALGMAVLLPLLARLLP
jgi:predicted murein hydrolase (TIGR00659 family)